MATTANSPSWVRTYTNDDATKYQIAYRSNNTWREDAKGRPVPGSFTTNLQVDRIAIDGNVTGGGVNATWTTAATRGTAGRTRRPSRYCIQNAPTGEGSSQDLTTIRNIQSM